MWTEGDRGSVLGGAQVAVLLVLALGAAGGITSATAAACSDGGPADCRPVADGVTAVESALRAASLGSSTGIVGAPPWAGGEDGSPGRGDERREDDDDEESRDGVPGNNGNAPERGGNNPESSGDAPGRSEGGDSAEGAPDDSEGDADASEAQDEAPGNGGDAPGHSEDAPGHSDDAPGRSDDAPGRNGSGPGRPANATHPGDDVGNGTANATGRRPPPTVPAAVNLTARGRSAEGDETVVNASVGDVRKNERVRIDFDARGAARSNRSNASDVAVSNIDLTPTRNGSFTMNLTAAERIEGSPEFETDDGSESLTQIRVDHSISNAELNGAVDIGFEVSKARLANESVAPENVALYRYENGSWTELPTEVVGETEAAFRFTARSPGLSEFAAGAKRARFTVETVDVAVEEITVGDEVRVHVTVGNDGGADGDFVAQLHLDGRSVDERSLTIAAGGQRQTLFDHAIADAGEYEVRVNDVVAGAVVVRRSVDGANASTATASGSPTDAAGPTDPTAASTDSSAASATDGAQTTGIGVASPVFHPTPLVFVVLVAVAARLRRR